MKLLIIIALWLSSACLDDKINVFALLFWRTFKARMWGEELGEEAKDPIRIALSRNFSSGIHPPSS